mmetsp:Transcript_25073/g.65079  ORF Transcript_25073/g.65079 Transcript_25073/m.65079 type:complete len:235 (-) Transcript_25073:472-1176(-)
MESLGATRVVGFHFAEPNERLAGGDPQRGLPCPVSPLGSLLQNNKRGSASSPNLFRVPSAPGSTTSTDDETVPYNEAAAICNQAAHHPTVQRVPVRAVNTGSCAMDEDDGDECCFSQPCSEPIPIPEPRPKTPDESSKPKNLKRVPEPPMVRCVTAPAIVEELYAEYEKAKQQMFQQQMYQHMIAQEMPRKLTARRKSEAAVKAPIEPEVEKLSWRTVYTHMQTYGFEKRMTCN